MSREGEAGMEDATETNRRRRGRGEGDGDAKEAIGAWRRGRGARGDCSAHTSHRFPPTPAPAAPRELPISLHGCLQCSLSGRQEVVPPWQRTTAIPIAIRTRSMSCRVEAGRMGSKGHQGAPRDSNISCPSRCGEVLWGACWVMTTCAQVFQTRL